MRSSPPEALAGVPADGAAGTIFEALSKLSCTLAPTVIQDKAGGGADCHIHGRGIRVVSS